MFNSIDGIKSSYTSEKRESDRVNHYYGYAILRPIGNYIAYCFIRIGLSANAVTLIGLILQLVAFYFILFTSKSLIIPALLINIWLLLDFVDGTIARVKNQQSIQGAYYDALSGFLVENILHISVGYYLFLHVNSISIDPLLFLTIGIISSLLFQFYRLAKYEYFRIVGYSMDMVQKKVQISPISTEQILKGIKSFEIPTMVIFILFGKIWIWFLIVCLFRILISIAGLWKLILEVSTSNQ
jgi:phosphatidylglycerophosphate synthase